MGGPRITEFTTARCRLLWARGESVSEIARTLGISPVAVRQRVTDLEHGCLKRRERAAPPVTENRRRATLKRSHVSTRRKLTDEQAAEIRDDPRSSRQLAKVYGVDKATINRIRSGACYR